MEVTSKEATRTLVCERALNVDSVSITENDNVLVKAHVWDAEDEMSVHYVSGMYGAPRVGDTIIIRLYT